MCIGSVGVCLVGWLCELSVWVDLFIVMVFVLHLQGPLWGVRMMVGAPSLPIFMSAEYNLVHEVHAKVFWTSISVKDVVSSSCTGETMVGGASRRWKMLSP